MSYSLVLGNASTNGGTLDDVIYEDIKYGFQELLSIRGVPITFQSIEKQCLSAPLDAKQEWSAAGWLPETTTRVELLDTDFAEFSLAGIEEAQTTVELEGITFQVVEIKKLSSHPLVSMMLNKSK